MLTPRLQALFDLVPFGTLVADVGCDHGYLAKALAEQKGCYVWAIDNKQGPLLSATANFLDSSAKRQLLPVLSDGFKQAWVPPFVIIAGVGGQTICEILASIPCYRQPEALLLLPHNHHPEVRYFLAQHGFMIEKEEVIAEQHLFYEAIFARRCERQYELTSNEALFGPYLLKERPALWHKKWKTKLEKLLTYQVKREEPIPEITELINILQEVLNAN